MSFRFTLVLLVLAIVVIGGIAVAQKNAPPSSQATVTPTPVLIDLKVEDVTGFDVKTKDRETELTKDGQSWKLVKPEQDPNVDQSKVSGLVAQVATLKGSRTVAKSSDDLAPFGLNDPQLSVTLSTKDGKTNTLLVGNKNVNGNSYYAMTKGGPDVALIDVSLPNDLLGIANTPPKATPTPTPTNTPVTTPTPTPAPSSSPAPSGTPAS